MDRTLKNKTGQKTSIDMLRKKKMKYEHMPPWRTGDLISNDMLFQIYQ